MGELVVFCIKMVAQKKGYLFTVTLSIYFNNTGNVREWKMEELSNEVIRKSIECMKS